MKINQRLTAPLGELVAAAFDGARQHSADRREVTRLAARAVNLLRRRAPSLRLERLLPMAVAPVQP